jgi:hypothetical protein
MRIKNYMIHCKIQTTHSDRKQKVNDIFDNLIPKPNFIQIFKHNSKIAKKIKIDYAGLQNSDSIFEEIKSDFNKELYIDINFVQNINLEENPEFIGFSNNKFFKKFQNDDESYVLIINESGVDLYATKRNGFFYSMQTLIQIILLSEKDENFIYIPNFLIFDYPSMKIRGVADEISRGLLPTVKFLKKYIYYLSKYKMNSYYIGYEQNWFDFKNYPVNYGEKATLNAVEIKELDEYAKRRFVDLAPIYTSFGHQDDLLLLPDYFDMGEFYGSQCYNITDPRIYEMMESHYNDLAENFSSKTFHMGCDESFDLGLYRSREYLDKVGKGQALFKHYIKMYEMAKKYGKEKVILYHDIAFHYEEELRKAPRDLILMYWEYNPKKKFKALDKIVATGLPIIVSPSHLNWSRPFPDYIKSAENIINLIEYSKNINRMKNESIPGIIGQMNSTWGDFAYPGNLRENNIYGSILSGAASWTEEKINSKKFLDSFSLSFYGISTKSTAKELGSIIWEISKLNKYYNGIMPMLPQVFFMHLYRHPFYSLKTNLFIKKYLKCYEDISEIKDRIIKLNNNNIINQNTIFIEYLLFSLDLIEIMAKKEKIKSKSIPILKKLVKNPEKIKNLSNNITQMDFSIEEFEKDLSKLILKFQRLWLEGSKKGILDFQLGRMKKLKQFYEEKRLDLKNKIYYRDPFLNSEWITTKKLIKPPIGAFFRKQFELDDEIDIIEANIIAIGGDYTKVYINGILIGHVVSRTSLSYVPIAERVKNFNVLEYLLKGSNVIGLESYCYTGSKTTANALLRIKIKNQNSEEIINIPTDKSWKLLTGYTLDEKDPKKYENLDRELKIPQYWNKNDIESNNLISNNLGIWKDVKSLGFPPNFNLHIYDEDILSGKVPYTEDQFGFDSTLIGVISTTFNPTLARILKPLLKLVKRILKIL